MVNFQEHVYQEMKDVGIDQFFVSGGKLQDVDWRTYLPHQLFKYIEGIVEKRLS